VIDLKAHWEQIITANPSSYEHPDYTVSQWKRDALSGKTRMGYPDIISALLDATRCEIPKVLLQFRPKTTFGKSVQRAVVAEFSGNGACIVARANGHGWFAMRYAFENLIPFIVARGENSFIVAKDTEENRADLRELCAETIYEWDARVVPLYENM
jgi:hypothetical protein